MNRHFKLLLATALGLTATLACAAASTTPARSSTDVQPLTGATSDAPATGTLPAGNALATGDSSKSDAGPGDPPPGDGGNKYPACPHGALEDPHRGFIRCLAPGEKSPFEPSPPDGGAPGAGDGGPPADGGTADAGSGGSDAGTPDGGSGSGSGSSAADAGTGSTADAGTPDAAAPEPAKPGPPPIVEMKSPKFENGDVPRAEKNLTSKKVTDAIAKCVADAGGLKSKTASLKVEFLVRARGKAEGVEVTPTGVSEDAAKCVRNFLKNRSVGYPSADPVGVTVIFSLKPAGK
ncbi:MAG: hypothetical protein R3B70_22395 [Polyangiaceae bacterium]